MTIKVEPDSQNPPLQQRNSKPSFRQLLLFVAISAEKTMHAVMTNVLVDTRWRNESNNDPS